MRDKLFNSSSDISDFRFDKSVVAALESLVATFSASTLLPFCL